MKYSHFEQLPVWNSAVEFALLIFKFTNIADLRGLGDTKIQLEHASLSISNSIAEGFERGTNGELIDFLYLARGSVAEARSMLCLCSSVPRFSSFKAEIANLKGKSENISRQLVGWLESLKKSTVRGTKYLSYEARGSSTRDGEHAEFDRQMEEFRRSDLETLRRRSEDFARQRIAKEEADELRRMTEESAGARVTEKSALLRMSVNEAIERMVEEDAIRRLAEEDAMRRMIEDEDMVHTVEPA